MHAEAAFHQVDPGVEEGYKGKMNGSDTTSGWGIRGEGAILTLEDVWTEEIGGPEGGGKHMSALVWPDRVASRC